MLKSKIDALAILPEGVRVNTEAVWQKIDQSLHRKRRRQRVFWFAAACFVLVTGSIILLLGTPSTRYSPVVVNQLPHQNNVSPDQLPRNPQADAEENKQPTAKPVKNSPIIKRVEAPPVLTIESQMMENTKPSEMVIVPPMQIPAPQNAVASQAVALTQISPKPALKIMHINELNIAPPPAPTAGNHAARPGFAFFRSNELLATTQTDACCLEDTVAIRRKEYGLVKSLTHALKDN